MKRGLYLAAAFVGAAMFSVGYASARGTLIGDTGAIASTSSSGGGGCPGGSGGEVVLSGASACAASSDLVVDGVVTSRLPLEVVRSSDASIYAQVIATASTRSAQVGPYNSESAANGLLSARGSNASSRSGSFLGIALDDDVDLKVSGTTAGFLLGTTDSAPLVMGTADAERLRITPAGDVQLTGAISKVRGAAPAGSCALDGASPSRCSSSVADGSVCVCAVQDSIAGAKDGCSVSRSGTTLTITSSNGASWTVNWICL